MLALLLNTLVCCCVEVFSYPWSLKASPGGEAGTQVGFSPSSLLLGSYNGNNECLLAGNIINPVQLAQTTVTGESSNCAG